MTPELTPAQLATLKADILADPILAAQPDTPDGADAIANAYNLAASPPYTVWKTSVLITQIGDNIVATDLAGLSTLNATRLQTIAQFSPVGVNPSLPDRRQFFDDVFSGAGGAATRAKLLILWKRLATRAEQRFATGTGSDAVPAMAGPTGPLTFQEVQVARALP